MVSTCSLGLRKGCCVSTRRIAGSYGLERHLVTINDLIEEFKPQVVVIDPVTNFFLVGPLFEVKSMVTRLIDMFKSRQITALFTSLTLGEAKTEPNELSISSQMDTWILLRNLESNGERNRGLYVSKSRGMQHSNQIREFVLTDQGVQLLNVYAGSSGMVTGSARVTLRQTSGLRKRTANGSCRVKLWIWNKSTSCLRHRSSICAASSSWRRQVYPVTRSAWRRQRVSIKQTGSSSKKRSAQVVRLLGEGAPPDTSICPLLRELKTSNKK